MSIVNGLAVVDEEEHAVDVQAEQVEDYEDLGEEEWVLGSRWSRGCCRRRIG